MMNTQMSQFMPKRSKSMRMQITDAVRKMIISGKLPPLSRLPSTQELAAQWDTSVPTVHKALNILVKEGVLERTTQLGTFVRQHEQRLERVGIYTTYETKYNSVFAFSQVLCHEIHKQLLDKNIQDIVWTDTRPPSERSQPWEELVKAISKRQFQVLIVPMVSQHTLSWLKKLPIKVVFLSASHIRNRVDVDILQWAETSMKLLSEEGSKRVGIISCIDEAYGQGSMRPYKNTKLYDTFYKSASQYGLDLRPEWIFKPQQMPISPLDWSHFGYDSVMALWEQSDRPDGLAIYEDITARSALMAILHQHIRVPEDLKLVLHRNYEIDFLCPVPAAFIDLHISEIATALIKQSESLYNNEKISVIKVKHHPVGSSQIIDKTNNSRFNTNTKKGEE